MTTTPPAADSSVSPPSEEEALARIDEESTRLAARLGEGLKDKVRRVLFLLHRIRRDVVPGFDKPERERAEMHLEGAENALFNRENPDRLCHFAASTRHLLEMLLKKHAPDDEVLRVRQIRPNPRRMPGNILLPERAECCILHAPAWQNAKQREYLVESGITPNSEVQKIRRFIRRLQGYMHYESEKPTALLLGAEETFVFAASALEWAYKCHHYGKSDLKTHLDRIAEKEVPDAQAQMNRAVKEAKISLETSAASSNEEPLALFAKTMGVSVERLKKFRDDFIWESEMETAYEDHEGMICSQVSDACRPMIAEQFGIKEAPLLDVFCSMLSDDLLGDLVFSYSIVEDAGDHIVVECDLHVAIPLELDRSYLRQRYSFYEEFVDGGESAKIWLQFDCTARTTKALSGSYLKPDIDPLSPSAKWDPVSVKLVGFRPRTEEEKSDGSE